LATSCGHHYRYHPLFGRLRTLIAGGRSAGDASRATFCIHFAAPATFAGADYNGGALMDLGCYAVPAATSRRRARVRSARQVDVRRRRPLATAELAFPTGATARVTCGLLRPRFLSIHARHRHRGPDRRPQPSPPVLPPPARPHARPPVSQVRSPSYDYQLRAFVATVRAGTAIR
jgi:predicted dehydrogenase